MPRLEGSADQIPRYREGPNNLPNGGKEYMRIVIAAKWVAMLVLTLSLAVAMVACQGAVGKPGDTGPPGPSGETSEPSEPTNLAPIARAPTLDAVMLVEKGDAAPINVAANFVDPEGQTLTLTHSVEPAEGVVTVDLADGVLTVTPVAAGPAVITVTATDAGGLNASATINVTVAPEGMMPPMYVPDSLPARIPLKPGEQRVISGADIDAAFDEVEDEELVYSFTVDYPSIVQVTQADDNTVTITALAAVGDAHVTIIATDDDDLPAEHEILVSVRTTLQPEASGTPDPVALDVGGDATTVDVSGYFSDPGVGDVTYAAVSDSDSVATAVAVGSMVTITPEGDGSAKVTVTASNSHGTASQMISVTVDATPPTAQGTIPDVILMSGQVRSVALAQYFAPGAAGDTLTYSVSGENSMVSARVLGDTLLIEALGKGRRPLQ